LLRRLAEHDAERQKIRDPRRQEQKIFMPLLLRPEFSAFAITGGKVVYRADR
jgi:hypothetical protein